VLWHPHRWQRGIRQAAWSPGVREPGRSVTIWPGFARALIHALGAALMGVIVVVRVRYSCRAM
jgi:hypothetical protein